MDSNEHLLIYRIALSHSFRLNNFRSLPLLEHCGGIEGFFNEKEEHLRLLFNTPDTAGLPLERGKWLHMGEQEYSLMLREGISCSCWEDYSYPPLLRHCPDAPLILFHKGPFAAPERPILAVVGTRKASERCKSRVELLLKQLAETPNKPVIVSGLAYGIDLSAHQAALRYGLTTQAVMGHGLHTIYPAAHRYTAEKILASGGCLISEFPSTSPILPVNFLQRNRIIAGMTEGVLVAESATRGGAMATARQAFSYDRTVMAIPGRPEDHYSAGCNLLIKEQIASMTEELSDLFRALNWKFPTPAIPVQTSIDFFGNTAREKNILTILHEKGEVHIDNLVLLAGIPVSELAPLLLKLELEGKIRSLPGKHYTGSGSIGE